MDPIAARQKEEQRRRQQAYAQALAQQVQQRDLQKQRDKEIERQGTSHWQQGHYDAGNPQHQVKDFWDGFGQKETHGRTNFARGQRQPTPQQQLYPPHPPAMEQSYQQQSSSVRHGGPMPRDPPEPRNNNRHHEPFPEPGNPQLAWKLGCTNGNTVPPPFGFSHEPEHQSIADEGFHRPYQEHPHDGFPPPPAPHIEPHQMHQHREQQQQQQWSLIRNGRRMQPDGGGDGDADDRARRKLQQQQEVQHALQQQVEEKKRQKLEEKRKQDEEDRREMERFEAEQRRIKQEEERAKEEKRRKQAVDDELVRVQQQAAVSLALHQKKKQHHQQQNQIPEQYHSQQQHQQQHPHASPPELNPFANSRAQLFVDPPSRSPDHRMQNVVAKVMGQHQVTHSPPPHQSRHKLFNNHPVHDAPFHQHSYPPLQPHQVEERIPWSAHSPSQHQVAPHVDPMILLRQYDEMKEELMRQRQLVDQLRQAQVQIQRHAQPTNDPIPTLSDLEQLCNELREELEHREHAHRQELENFKRQQQSLQKQQLLLQSQRNSPIEHNELQFVPERNASIVERRQHSSYHQSSPNQQHSPPVRHRQMERSSGSHIFQQQRQRDSVEEVELELGSQSSQPIFQSIQTESESVAARASLQCDSKLVHFDGHVRTQQEDPQAVPPSATPSRTKRSNCLPELHINLEDSVDDLVSRVSLSHNVGSQQETETSSNKKSQLQSFHASHRREDNNQEETNENIKALSVSGEKQQLSEDARGDESDTLGFFVQDFRNNHDEFRQRYSASPVPNAVSSVDGISGAAYRNASSARVEEDLASSWDPSTVLQHSKAKWLHLLDEEDEDDELNASLTGDELEAIFQRNVRRHGILLGFQKATGDHASTKESASRTVHKRTMAWTQLQHQLEDAAASTIVPSNRDHNDNGVKMKTAQRRRERPTEDSLVTSSRWMPTLHT